MPAIFLSRFSSVQQVASGEKRSSAIAELQDEHAQNCKLCYNYLPVRLLPERQPCRAAVLGVRNIPMDYLLKTEPAVYSFQQLQKDHETVWDGVANPAAVKHLREMHKGDKLIIYHTGEERRAVGTAHVLSVDASDPKVPLVTIAVDKAIANPIALADIKQSTLFSDSPLLRQGRLSVVPLTEAQYRALLSGEL